MTRLDPRSKVMANEAKASEFIRRNATTIEEFAGSSSQLMGLVVFLLELAEKDAESRGRSASAEQRGGGGREADGPCVFERALYLHLGWLDAEAVRFKQNRQVHQTFKECAGRLRAALAECPEPSPPSAGSGGAGEWVRCAERMPGNNQRLMFWVHGWLPDSTPGVGCFVDDGRGQYWGDDTQMGGYDGDEPKRYHTKGANANGVTHWQTLPAPPAAEPATGGET